MTCAHSPLTLYFTASLIAFGCGTLTLRVWLGIHAAGAFWRRLTRAEDATRVWL